MDNDTIRMNAVISALKHQRDSALQTITELEGEVMVLRNQLSEAIKTIVNVHVNEPLKASV